jgi:hypothetical protein
MALGSTEALVVLLLALVVMLALLSFKVSGDPDVPGWAVAAATSVENGGRH